MKQKRQRAETSPLELANRKTDEQFINDYLKAGSVMIHSMFSGPFFVPV